MEHIGIDLGARHSHIAVVGSRGDILRQTRVRTTELVGWLKSRERSHVVMESCTQSVRIADASLSCGHETKVVPAHLVRTLGVGRRGIKTDERDALMLAQASQRVPDLPSIHQRSEESRERRAWISSRKLLLDSRKSISLHIKSWLRGRLTSIRGRANSKYFVQAVRTLVEKHGEELPTYIETLLVTYEHLTEQIEALDKRMEEQQTQDAVCRRFCTAPGIGVHTSLAFKAQIDDPHRFASANELGSYLALVPGESTTGGRIQRTGTLKQGPKHLKGLLIQAAWVMWRTRPNDPLVQWAKAKAETRGKQIAIVALARKIAVILWAMWKHQEDYDPTKASRFQASN